MSDPIECGCGGRSRNLDQYNNTGQVRLITTASGGAYRFALIPPGNYQVQFAASGFKVAEVPSVTVNVSETPVLNQALELGQQAESVLVDAEGAVLQTADSTLGTVVSGNAITELPLASSRQRDRCPEWESAHLLRQHRWNGLYGRNSRRR